MKITAGNLRQLIQEAVLSESGAVLNDYAQVYILQDNYPHRVYLDLVGVSGDTSHWVTRDDRNDRIVLQLVNDPELGAVYVDEADHSVYELLSVRDDEAALEEIPYHSVPERIWQSGRSDY